MIACGASRHFAGPQQLRRFGKEAHINLRRDLLELSFACIHPDDMLRKHRHVVRPPRLLVVDPTMNGPMLAERLAHHHPHQNNVPFPERRDFLSAERVHVGNRLPLDRCGGTDCKPHVRFRGETDVNRRTRLAETVEHDPSGLRPHADHPRSLLAQLPRFN